MSIPPQGAQSSERHPATENTLGYVLEATLADRLNRNADGLIAAVVQDAGSGRVLMMAWMDDAALAETLATRRGVYFSRSRGRRWVKGETSGHVQYVRSVEIDCDGDTILLRVDQAGAACHNGTTSCFDTATMLSEPTEIEERDG